MSGVIDLLLMMSIITERITSMVRVYKRQSHNVIQFPTKTTAHQEGWKELMEYFDRLRSEDEWDYNDKKNEGE